MNQPPRLQSIPDSPSALEVRNLSKTFGGVVALNNVSLYARAGEVAALVGENGAGKSTLIKCVAGVHPPDSGTIHIGGRLVQFDSPFASRLEGIETVYQDLALADNLDVAGNIFLGRERSYGIRRGFALRKKEMRRKAKDILVSYGIKVPSISTEAGFLSGGQRQGIAIARAAEWGSRVVIMDEPTAALGVQETVRVLDLIVQLAGRGLAVMVVSHNLEQVLEVSTRIWVLRRGRLVASLLTSETNRQAVIHYITGLTAASEVEEAPPISRGLHT